MGLKLDPVAVPVTGVGAVDPGPPVALGPPPPALPIYDVIPGQAPPPGPRPERPRRRSPWPWVALLLALLLGGGVAAYLLTRPAKRLVPPVTLPAVSFL